jgi:hypothetical protein
MTSSNPAVTIALITYNQATVVEKSVRSAFSQTYGPLEIILSDDASTDGTFAILQRLAAEYKGPHKVWARKNDVNLKSTHIPALCPLASGDIIVQFHGDDVSVPHRVERLVSALQATGSVLVGSNALQIEGGSTPRGTYLPRSHKWEWNGPLAFVRGGWSGEFLGATLAFHRSLYSAPFPTIDLRKMFGGNDVLLPFRAALVGRAAWCEEPLVLYHRHIDQASHQLADWTSGRAGFTETVAAHHLMVSVQRLRDLAAIAPHHPDPTFIEDMRKAVNEDLLLATTVWSEKRASAMADGLRPVWMPVATYEQWRKAKRSG